MQEILVSICCLTYNHELYIRECLNGFLMQKTDFLFEVLIHDDASTDHTADIIREYEAKYPDIIKPIYREKNLYSQGNKFISKFNYERVRGKYIAYCEGDDFWTDPFKLQKQFDFMESHPDYVLCCSDADKLIQDRHMRYSKKYRSIPCDFSFNEIMQKTPIIACTTFFRTCTMLQWMKERESMVAFSTWLMEDYPWYLFVAARGRVNYTPESYACYRILSSSASHGSLEHMILFYRSKCKISLYFNQKYGKDMHSEDLIRDYARCCVRLIYKRDVDNHSLLHYFWKLYFRWGFQFKRDLKFIMLYFSASLLFSRWGNRLKYFVISFYYAK